MDFDTLKPYTITTVIPTNLKINLSWLYDILTILPVDPEEIAGKKQKDRFKKYILQLDPPHGTITMAQYRQFVKGWKFTKKIKSFRNGLSLVMYVGKLITVKVPERGSIQLTGCGTDEHSEIFIKELCAILNQYEQGPETYMCLNINNPMNITATPIPFMITIQTVMTDIVFNIGFPINLQHLDQYMHCNTKFNSLLETSFGYTGVNIKLPFDLTMDSPCIKHLVGTLNEGQYAFETHLITYDQYLSTLNTKDQTKMMKKQRRNTFLAFHSGSVIMSGMTLQYMREIFNQFVNEMTTARSRIEDRLTTMM
jgi:hypothetical protein